MSRPNLPFSLLLAFGAIALAALVSVVLMVFVGTQPVWGTPDPGLPVRSADRGVNRAIREKLDRPINLQFGIDPNTPLKDALEFLADRHDLTFIVDSNAFAAIGVQKVEEQPVQLPKMSGVPIRVVLRLLLSQIKGDVYSGAFILKDGHVEVTTTYHAAPQLSLWGTPDGRQQIPRVDVDGHGQALDDALQEMADTTGLNIVIDARVAGKAKKQVLTSLTNVPIDTAVRVLADQAELRLVIMDDVLYITSRDNAKDLEADQDKRIQRMLEAEKRQMERGGLTPGGGPMPN
ncbi:MAG: hypothetical protein K2R98_04330 [Gemmataceae bacterium]|nr:hypothetical protein [Gemmataceae bacterium]